MTLAFPLDILDGFPGWSTQFSPMTRKEQSRVASGRTYVKDLGSPLWRASYQSTILSANDLDYWRARLEALDDGGQTFRGWAMSRKYPIAYPRGSWPTGPAFAGVGTVGSVNVNRKAISAAGFPAGFTFSVGDLIQIGNGDLHRVEEQATNGQFEIYPHLWPGVVAGAALNVLKPSCIMALVPGSVLANADVSTGRGSISFDALEAR